MKESHKDRYRKLGLKIAYYRKYADLTQEQLAEKLQMNTSSLGAIEAPNVERYPSLETIFEISDILGVSLSKLFEDI